MYDAWGNHTAHYTNGGGSTGAQYNPFRYRGYYYDSDMGFYYLNDRYYDSNIGRFLTPDDPSYLGANGDLLSYNLYAYCSNNPVMYVDPTGHLSTLVVFFVIVGISALAGAIDGGITAQLSGQNFWKGFAAGAIGGTIGGVVSAGATLASAWVPGLAQWGYIVGRGISSFTYNMLNEKFQTGKIDVNSNLGLYMFDVLQDMMFSVLYYDGLTSICGGSDIVGGLVFGSVDSGVDIVQTLLMFSPQAQQRIRESLETTEREYPRASVSSNKVECVY